MGIRLLAALGARLLIVTNAAGGIDKNFKARSPGFRVFRRGSFV